MQPAETEIRPYLPRERSWVADSASFARSCAAVWAGGDIVPPPTGNLKRWGRPSVFVVCRDGPAAREISPKTRKLKHPLPRRLGTLGLSRRGWFSGPVPRGPRPAEGFPKKPGPCENTRRAGAFFDLAGPGRRRKAIVYPTATRLAKKQDRFCLVCNMMDLSWGHQST